MTTTVPLYRDPSLPIDARVADLLARMTRVEKVAQLGSFWAFEVIKESRARRGPAGASWSARVSATSPALPARRISDRPASPRRPTGSSAT